MGWQCRIRQYAVRKDEGRPSTGMMPELTAREQSVGPINVQLVKTASDESTAQFRFMYQKTVDPKDRRTAVLKLLAERFYQIPAEFSDELTAIFAVDSELASQLVTVGQCGLVFKQGNQRYDLNCAIRTIDRHEPGYQASYWQNALFNPAMPGAVKVLGFRPDWSASIFREI